MIRPSRFGIKFAPSPKITLEYRKNDNELQYASVDLNECNWNEDDESDILNFVLEKRTEFSDPRVSHSQLKRLILKIRDEMIKSLRKPMKENNIDRKSDDDLISTEDVSEISEIEKLEDAETKEDVEMKEEKEEEQDNIVQSPENAEDKKDTSKDDKETTEPPMLPEPASTTALAEEKEEEKEEDEEKEETLKASYEEDDFDEESFEDDDASIPEEVADEIDSASEIESAESFDMDTQNGDEEEEEDNWFKST